MELVFLRIRCVISSKFFFGRCEFCFLLGNELHFLNHAPANDFVFFVQAESDGFSTPDFFSDPILDEAGYLFLGGFALHLCSP